MKIEKEVIDYKEIKSTDVIGYVDRTDKWGTAEFQICTLFKRGYLKEVYFTRRQQENNENYCLKVEGKINVFCITAWTHKTEHPRIWRQFWCKDHKSICHETYVPRGTSKIVFAYHFGNSLDIRFE